MTKKLLKKELLLTVILLLSTSAQLVAQKKVAYIQFSKVMDATASQTGNATITGSDAITRMLTATGFNVKVYACDANGLDLATSVSVDTEIPTFGPDLIIMQETWGSTSAAIRPSGILAFRKLGALNIPLIYNKSFTFQKGANRTITSTTGTAYDVVSTSSLAVQVTPGNEANPLFNGITGTSIPIFFAGATDLGATVASGALATAAVKGLSLVNDLEITTPVPGTPTLLAGASGTVAAGTAISTTSSTNSLLINRYPAGTQLGTDANDKLGTKDMITFACNYGAIAAGDGKNVTNEFLTLWRNAAYLLTEQTVPNTLYVNPQLGVNESTLEENSITVSPNPTSGLVTVNGVSDVKSITVFDVAGKQVLISDNTTSVNLSHHTKGIYFVKVETEKGSSTKKVIVK